MLMGLFLVVATVFVVVVGVATFLLGSLRAYWAFGDAVFCAGMGVLIGGLSAALLTAEIRSQSAPSEASLIAAGLGILAIALIVNAVREFLTFLSEDPFGEGMDPP